MTIIIGLVCFLLGAGIATIVAIASAKAKRESVADAVLKATIVVISSPEFRQSVLNQAFPDMRPTGFVLEQQTTTSLRRGRRNVA
jgi:ABC-type dipeptide/oligopeptide/nickel transport system permease component